jgi:hypothetical protein
MESTNKFGHRYWLQNRLTGFRTSRSIWFTALYRDLLEVPLDQRLILVVSNVLDLPNVDREPSRLRTGRIPFGIEALATIKSFTLPALMAVVVEFDPPGGPIPVSGSNRSSPFTEAA